MKCPHCGYDQIMPNYRFCPQCRTPLNSDKKENTSSNDTPQASFVSQEKGWLNRIISGWTYEEAIADPYKYAVWAYKNPNDNRHFLEKWNKEGYDLTLIRQAIMEANRARRENPSVDRVDVEASIIDANQQSSRGDANSAFISSVNAAPTMDSAAIVRNKAIWKLAPGELARHIAPDEWQYVSEHLEGLVIEEGTSAVIYVDGVEVAQMGSGMYVFDDKHVVAAQMEAEKREQHHVFFSNFADRIYRFFTGHNRSESASEREARRRRVQQIVNKLKKDTIIDVYLKSDMIFPAIFGAQHVGENNEDYLPYVIQSRYLDVNVGVNMQMKIDDFKQFIANYMPSRKAVFITDIVKSADAAVFSILKYELRDVEISERGLDEATFLAIKNHLRANLPKLLHGVLVVEILDIATTNEQLARFRKVEEKLYCSEREYDFLVRTNIFRNRLAGEENDQKIREARTDLELRKRLDEVNKDGLLHDDEMAQFEALLSNQKIIREAQNQDDLDRAMSKIERSRLITRDEFDVFNEDLNNRRFDRGQVSEQMRARSLMTTTLAKLEVDKILQIANIHNTAEVSEAEFEAFKQSKGHEAESVDLEAAIYGRQYVLDHQKMLDSQADAVLNAKHENELAAIARMETRAKDEYDDERDEVLHGRKMRDLKDDHGFSMQKQHDEYDLEKQRLDDELKRAQLVQDMHMTQVERAAAVAARNMQSMMDAELAKQKEQHSHEQSMASIDADVKKTELTAEQQMTADQIMAKNIGQMDAAAQAKFAESFSHLTEVEFINKTNAEKEELYKQMIDMAKQNGVNVNNLQTENLKQQQETMRQMMNMFANIVSSNNGGQQSMMNSMVGAIQNVAAGHMRDLESMKNEYREQAAHQQARTDDNQKQALNYTSRVAVSENIPPVGGMPTVNVSVSQRRCPMHGVVEDPNATWCPVCGETLI